MQEGPPLSLELPLRRREERNLSLPGEQPRPLPAELRLLGKPLLIRELKSLLLNAESLLRSALLRSLLGNASWLPRPKRRLK